jgi:hypothetical protein
MSSSLALQLHSLRHEAVRDPEGIVPPARIRSWRIIVEYEADNALTAVAASAGYLRGL